MRKVGNVVSNQIYNPENKRPPVPVDADEADSAMERFIRQKYMNNVAAKPTNGRQPTSPRSEEGPPPPLPPKNSSKFSLRSAMSLNPLSRSRKDSTMPSPTLDRRPSSHGSTGKVSRVFGAAVNYDDGDDTDRKLSKLRDMGFHDTQRNAIVLKGVNGNLERAIESLVRLGEGGSKSPAPPPISKDANLRPSRSMTPLNGTKGSGVGLSLAAKEQPRSPSSTSNNPFDRVSSPVHAQPQTAQSTGSMQTNNPYNQSLNPFGAPSQQQQQQDQLSQVFGQLDISNSQQQPLFPNRTGGLTPQAQTAPQYPPQMVPSAPSSPQMYQGSSFQNMAYPHTVPLQQQPTGYNPFFQNSAPQQQYQQQQYQQQYSQQYQPQFQPFQPQATGSPYGLSLNTQQQPQHQQQQSPASNNPFGPSPTRIASPSSLGQIPEQSQPQMQSPNGPAAGANNPFFTSPAQTPSGMPQHGYGQAGYFQHPRHDTASIMALYGQYPQRSKTTDATQALSHTAIPEDSVAPSQPQPAPQAQAPAQPPVGAQRSMTQPLPQSNTTNNPFMNGGAPAGDDFKARHQSRESMNLGMDMAWTNGRHSPDAFASLARHG